MFTTSFIIISLFALALGKPVARNLEIHEFVEKIPAGFKLKGPASSDEVLKLRIALVQSDPTGLINKLMDVSTPSSGNYGQYLTKEDVRLFYIIHIRWQASR